MKRKPGQPKRAPLAAEAEKPAESWRLPSGETLAEFALHAGFVGSLMMASRAVEAAGAMPPAEAAETDEIAAPVRRRRGRRGQEER